MLGPPNSINGPPEIPASVGADDDLSARRGHLAKYQLLHAADGVDGVRTDLFATD